MACDDQDGNSSSQSEDHVSLIKKQKLVKCTVAFWLFYQRLVGTKSVSALKSRSVVVLALKKQSVL